MSLLQGMERGEIALGSGAGRGIRKGDDLRERLLKAGHKLVKAKCDCEHHTKDAINCPVNVAKREYHYILEELPR